MGFSNRDRLRRKMKSIPGAVRKAARAQLKANALELADMQRRMAPVDTGELRNSIRAYNVSTSTRISWRVAARDHKAAWVEFGTSASEARASRQNLNFRRTVVMTKAYSAHHATEARPFFWPSYRVLKRRFRARMNRAAKKALAEAIK
jgi:HK97 gp10 family phage protein